jgi:hypothetical protein
MKWQNVEFQITVKNVWPKAGIRQVLIPMLQKNLFDNYKTSNPNKKGEGNPLMINKIYYI